MFAVDFFFSKKMVSSRFLHRLLAQPIPIQFGSTSGDRENTVSVSMDRKTILLYNLDDPENALELAFQQRYGYIGRLRQGGCVALASDFLCLLPVLIHTCFCVRDLRLRFLQSRSSGFATATSWWALTTASS